MILMIACLAMAAARGGVALTAAGIGAAGQAAQGAASGAAPAVMGGMRDQDSLGYIVDSMFRPVGPEAPSGETGTGQAGTNQAGMNDVSAQPPAPSTEGGAVTLPLAATSDARSRRERLARGVRRELSQEDKTYLAQVAAQETGMAQPEAEQRVNQVMEKAKATKAEAEQKAKEAADAARKAGMYTALWERRSNVCRRVRDRVGGDVGRPSTGCLSDAFDVLPDLIGEIVTEVLAEVN
jgi:hypothetical protein